jgi:Tfp pilus assembly protein PilN
MIRINLLPQKKSRKAEPAQNVLAVGFAAVMVVALLVFLLIHRPLEEAIARDQADIGVLKKRIAQLKEKTKDFEKLEAAFAAAEEQQQAIARLNSARAVPAWMLHELSRILTKEGLPTMTPAMAVQVRTDPNRAWVQGWDAKHVWIDSFEENRGEFKLKGGAQSDSDMTQLALRMQASMFFKDVVPTTGKEVRTKAGAAYYEFELKGTVVY